VSFLPARAVRRAGALAVAAAALAAAPASARLYVATTLTLGDGEPAGQVIGYEVSGVVPSTDTLRLDVVRDGATIATGTGTGYVKLAPLAPRPGDQLTLTDLDTAETRTRAYAGRPALDAALCGDGPQVAGDRDDGATINLTAALSFGAGDPRNVSLALGPIAGAGTRFAATFPQALGPAWVLTANQGLVIDADFTAFDAVSRPLGACPVVETPAPAPAPSPAPAPAPDAAPAVPAPDVLPPAARVVLGAGLRRAAGAYRALLAGRFTARVSTSEPGTVTQTLYADDGAPLPRATAAAKARRRPTVLAAGRATAARAGAVAVTVRLSRTGRAAVRRHRVTKVALVTTVTDAAGNARVLAPRRLTLRRTG
jgi:hypothetical protein